MDLLNDALGVRCHKPEGTFYLFPDVSGCLHHTTRGGRRIETETDMALALLDEAHVSTAHGAAYGMSPDIRISYATNMESLREGCVRIQEFCRALR